jgi:hypothetical protein
MASAQNQLVGFVEQSSIIMTLFDLLKHNAPHAKLSINASQGKVIIYQIVFNLAQWIVF